MDLFTIDTVSEARSKLLSLVQPLFTRLERIATPHSLGRILAFDLSAPEDLPSFTRSTVDGYAVYAADTIGAGESIPTVLTLVGKVEMGSNAADCPGLSEGILPGECAYVPTGGMLPTGGDAMVMIENTELFGPNQVGVYTSAATGSHVISPGDDITNNTLVCPAGKRLGAADIGLAAALGIDEFDVFVRPNMHIISTGDELVAPHEIPLSGKVRDINSWALAAQAKLAGFTVSGSQVVSDDVAALTASVEQAKLDANIVLVSGGSSQGEKDATARIINETASTGVLTHGLALKPGKPTISGFDEPSETLLIGLPGHPMSAMMVFEVLLTWLLREAQGTDHPLPVPAILGQNLPSAAGKDTMQLVSLVPEKATGLGTSAEVFSNQLIAMPVHTKSGLVSKLAQSSGYLWIDRNVEGLAAGTPVAVYLLQSL